jgi:S13-like H2TH domain
VSGGKEATRGREASSEQRRRALQQANEVRSERAKLKKDLAAGTVGLGEILARPPACAQTARVGDLLLALPKIGSVKAGRILARCRISDAKTVAGLTGRQRAELTHIFRADQAPL